LCSGTAIIKQQDEAFITGMIPDYSRGRKARQAGSESRGGAVARAQRRKDLKALYAELVPKPLLNSLSEIRKYQLIAKKYKRRSGKKISAKTVERDLAYQKKLDKRGSSN
jgi:Skp family chaperone for outer membrane proteins